MTIIENIISGIVAAFVSWGFDSVTRKSKQKVVSDKERLIKVINIIPEDYMQYILNEISLETFSIEEKKSLEKYFRHATEERFTFLNRKIERARTSFNENLENLLKNIRQYFYIHENISELITMLPEQRHKTDRHSINLTEKARTELGISIGNTRDSYKNFIRTARKKLLI
ncbi:MAG: hypothetical protein M5R37_02155 [Melioribacteraceae bacterium]|nr:hypothetical protein [Melioribacteraceae bacterium]